MSQEMWDILSYIRTLVPFNLSAGSTARTVYAILSFSATARYLRSEIKGQARKTEEEVLERDMEVRAALDELIECWKQFVEDRRADVETDLQADKEANREKNR
ncbi:MAG TPA: hypothetical protein VFT30_12315 [Nitrospira sp.]|nr:hypothetical protein [Nitrospira sp.]